MSTQRRRSYAPPGDWSHQALCLSADADAFYPEKGQPVAQAQAICYRCPVRQPCLEYALGNNERHGVFGGLSERQRRRLRQGKQSLCDACRMPRSRDGCRWCAGVCVECGDARETDGPLCLACRGVPTVRQARTCRVEGCTSHARREGLCGTHARRAS